MASGNRIKERAKKVPQHIKDKVAKDIKAAKKMYGVKKPKSHWFYAIPKEYQEIVYEDFEKFWKSEAGIILDKPITKWSSLMIAFRWGATEMGVDFYSALFAELQKLGYN